MALAVRSAVGGVLVAALRVAAVRAAADQVVGACGRRRAATCGPNSGSTPRPPNPGPAAWSIAGSRSSGGSNSDCPPAAAAEARTSSAPPARGRQNSRRGRGYARSTPRAFADPRASHPLSCTGPGTAKVASRARIRPDCSASVRRSPGVTSTQLQRPGDGKSRVAGEDTPRSLRERSPIPGPPMSDRFTVVCLLPSETWEGLPVSSSVLWEQAKPGWRSAADTQ